MACALQSADVCQSANSNRERGWDWTDECSRVRLPGTYYAAATVIRPPADSLNGFEYVASVAGQSGVEEIDWSDSNLAAVGAVFQDGSVSWTAQAASAASLYKKIQTSAFSCANPDMTLSGAALVNTIDQQTYVKMGASVIATYAVLNTVAFDDGTIGVGIYNVEVE